MRVAPVIKRAQAGMMCMYSQKKEEKNPSLQFVTVINVFESDAAAITILHCRMGGTGGRGANAFNLFAVADRFEHPH